MSSNWTVTAEAIVYETNNPNWRSEHVRVAPQSGTGYALVYQWGPNAQKWVLARFRRAEDAYPVAYELERLRREKIDAIEAEAKASADAAASVWDD